MKRNAIFRILLPMLCLVVIFLCVPNARAEGEEPNYEEAHSVILQAYDDLLYAEEDTVTADVSACFLTADQLKELVLRTARLGEQPWYLASFNYKYSTSTGYATSVIFNRLNSNEYDYALYEQTVAEILAETVHPGMSQWQIALSIHDYLVANCAYDESLTYRTGYDALIRGTAVCKGYTEAYEDLLQRCGIPCQRANSEEMDHVWNLVKIGENWLHVDATWDDPTSDRQGRVHHKYFLISDAAISDEEHKHYGWKSEVTSTFTEWDTDRLWHDIESQFCFESKDLCYLRSKTGKTAYTIYSRDSQTGDWKKITSCDAGYIDIGGSKDSKYFYRNNGLSYYEGKLYYSDMVKVYSINPDGSGKKTVYTHNYKDNKTYIAGSFVSEGVLYMTLADHDGNLSAMQITLGTPQHTHSYTATTVAPSCGEMGCDLFTCTCGISYRTNYTAAVGHSYGEGVTVREATEYRSGIRRYTCTTCGDSYDVEVAYSPEPTVSNGDVPADEVTEEYILRRVAVVVGVLILFRLFRKKKK